MVLLEGLKSHKNTSVGILEVGPLVEVVPLKGWSASEVPLYDQILEPRSYYRMSEISIRKTRFFERENTEAGGRHY